jgi:hypothetical protein
MCIIAAIPQGKQISKATLKRCWENNQHGGGFMYSDGKKIIIYKELTSFKRYYRAFIEAKEMYSKSAFVCHFRISTHGKVNEDNCHPFHVYDNLGFCHNGIIRNAPTSNDYSDTYMFNETILKMLPKNFLSNLSIMALIKEYIGSGSKLCFLSYDSKLTFVNESAGQWDDGVWYSNGGYKEVKYYDRGGTRVGTYGTTYGGNSYGTNWKQGSVGFASAVIPNVSKKSEPKKVSDIDWDMRLKSDKLDREVIDIAISKEADYYSYNSKCAFCDTHLHTYHEKQNECCIKCEDRYTNEWHF